MADSSLVPVPRVPTPAMIEAYYRAHAEAPTVFASAEQVWTAMIEAAVQRAIERFSKDQAHG